MRCCRSTRQELLHWAAVIASASRVAALDSRRDTRCGRSRGRDAVSAVNLELVTLTEDRAVVTWYTGVPGTDDGLGRMLPAVTEGEVVYGTHPARLDRIAVGDGPSAYHYVELTGLEPGQTYYYRARSRGRAATPTPLHLVSGNAVGTSSYGLGSAGPYSFTTPQPPPGRYLFSIALCNDLHLGETTAGRIAGIPLLRGLAQRPGLAPYPEVMSRALVEDAARCGADYLLAAGDISAEGGAADLRRAKEILDGFGNYGQDYFVARGNHDRPKAYDSFRDGFFEGDGPTYFSRDLHGLRVVGLDTYDKPGNGGDAGGLSGEQLSWFRAGLRQHKDQPTVVFGHHPLAVPHSPFPVTSGQRLNRRQARSILDGYASAPGVFLHHAGHTHRNKRTIVPRAPGVTLQEVSAVKEYPGGFCLLRVHSGGYALNYYKTRSGPAREWSERSRRQAAGIWPQFALGRSVHDRNSVTAHDLSGVRNRPAVPTRDVTATALAARGAVPGPARGPASGAPVRSAGSATG
ncbi:metallophosphoesterase family protein [Streptomyces sp. GMY02]|uniref:purple acid phosphatase family protein n=1 Tax=Streptomyces sp. GMY02 TaxID=1333528 RepID=UPI001C2C3DFB|nr:metallophosphoesterase family protein [Streptomyces sp. GMY02]QXE35532.1 metallophosphoesterase family protein [Streptomyces sp. GMY02]